MKPVLIVLFWVLGAVSAVAQQHPARTVRGDTVIHTYANGRPSVKVLPWANDEQPIVLYAPDGTERFRLHNTRRHMIAHNELHFHPNGAVSRAEASGHPDGGIQRYESTITFDEQNRPLTETVTEQTHAHTSLVMPTVYRYDSTGQRIRQPQPYDQRLPTHE